MISGLRVRSQHYEEKLRELGLCTQEERRHQLDVTQNFKISRKWAMWTNLPKQVRARESDANVSRSLGCQAAGLT
jgi:hypothetical protein